MPAVLHAAHAIFIIHTRVTGGHLPHTAFASARAPRLQHIRREVLTLVIVPTGPSSYSHTRWLLRPRPVPGATACCPGLTLQVTDPARKTLG